MLKSGEVLAPFLGSHLSFINGLDPLGYQNVSSAIYSKLLPGLTNVTNLVRAYSFYCWLFKEYASQVNVKLSSSGQREFIRKAEYLVALVAAKHEIPKVSGKYFAQKALESGSSNIQLSKGIYNSEGGTENTYWKNSWGVFGQYYRGPLKTLMLIEEPMLDSGKALGINRCSEDMNDSKVSGIMLANAFDQNLNDNSKSVFLNCLLKGSVTLDELEILFISFNLSKVPFESLERELLVQLIYGHSVPVLIDSNKLYLRKQTIELVLKHAKTSIFQDIQDMPLAAYYLKGKIKAVENKALLCWYGYQINEFWQFACLGIFDGFLSVLERENQMSWEDKNRLVDKTVAACLSKLKTDENTILQSQFKTSGKVDYAEYELVDLIDQSSCEERVYFSFLLVLKIGLDNFKDLAIIEDGIKDLGVYDEMEVIWFIRDCNSRSLKLETIIRLLIVDKVLHRHLQVSIRKMGYGSQSTQKFILEEGKIRLIDKFGLGFSVPRLPNLYAFLTDLGLLDSDHKITSYGEKLLTETV